jgi:NAD(P)-dependent dehydrogenase (short-subunit alcohol dehydrogenase family)
MRGSNRASACRIAAPMHELFDLTGQVALITGSSRGIGRAIAERMAEFGARVVISSRKLAACEEVAAQITARGGVALALACNINDKAQLEALVSGTRAAFGKIDTLVCNAAVNPYFGPSQDIDDGAFDKVLQANVRSNHWLCQMVIPEMAERRGGAVIVVSSIGGLKGSATLGAYSISKAADMQLVRNLAVEWGPRNVRVNAIAPGIIRTDFARALWEDPDVYASAIQRYPLGRIGEPDEVAGAAVYLASRAGSFTTGQTLVIDGGATIS